MIRAAVMAMLLLTGAFVALAPVASATHSDCDGPYCCDRDVFSVLQRFADHAVEVVFELISRTTQFAAKTKCTVFQTLKLCSQEEWPPNVSPLRTNPSGKHGEYSPCYEFYAPGFEHLGGCRAGEALRHLFTPGSHYHDCILAPRVFAPIPQI